MRGRVHQKKIHKETYNTEIFRIYSRLFAISSHFQKRRNDLNGPEVEGCPEGFPVAGLALVEVVALLGCKTPASLSLYTRSLSAG